VIFFSIYTFIGKDFTPAVINEVQKDSPAMVGGLKEGDVILEIDNNEVQSIMDVSKYIMMSTDDVIDFKVKRSYDEIILNIKPDLVEGEDNLGNKINKRMVGIKLGAYNDQDKPRKTRSGPVNIACL
jgi:regulator of sigma E protease